jgi:hypothetical protein
LSNSSSIGEVKAKVGSRTADGEGDHRREDEIAILEQRRAEKMLLRRHDMHDEKIESQDRGDRCDPDFC